MKAIWKRLALMAAVMITPAMLCGCEEKPPVQGICYRITGGKNAMVLLGSIHVGSPDMEPYGSHILTEMEQADVFVFECDSDSPQVAAQTQAMMRLEDGTLQDVLSPELWSLVTQACAKAGLDPNVLKPYKPWAATSMLVTAAASQQMGARTSRQAVSRGVEQEVEEHVKGRSVRYLETAVSQLMLMEGFSPALQNALLEQSCDALLNPQENATLSQWPLWWRDGNAEAFANEYAQDDSLPPELTAEYHEALVSTRNRQMADALVAMLEEDEPHRFFVTVGLMHLVLPDDSILLELENRGYTIERLYAPQANEP